MKFSFKRIGAGVVAVATAAAAFVCGVGTASAAEFPKTRYFSTTVKNINIDDTDLPAFRYGFAGYDSANATNPVFSNAQLNAANDHFRKNAAYCMDVDLPAPGDTWVGKNEVTVSEEGTGHHAFTYVTNPTLVQYTRVDPPVKGEVAWVAANGYPNGDKFKKPLDAPDARAVTQLAIWIAAGQVRVQGGNGTTTATQAVSTANGHVVAGGVYSGGGQTNFHPYTMIGLAWQLAQDAKNAPDKDQYAAYYYKAAPLARNGMQRMLYAAKLPPSNGNLKMVKTSEKPAYSDKNNAYTMEGIEYGVWENNKCSGNPKYTFKLNAKGESNVLKNIPAKDYWVKETKTKTGYMMNDTVYKVTVKSGKTVTLK